MTLYLYKHDTFSLALKKEMWNSPVNTVTRSNVWSIGTAWAHIRQITRAKDAIARFRALTQKLYPRSSEESSPIDTNEAGSNVGGAFQ